MGVDNYASQSKHQKGQKIYHFAKMDILLQFFGRSEILSNARKIKEKMLLTVIRKVSIERSI